MVVTSLFLMLNKLKRDDGKKLYCLKQRIQTMKKRLFSFRKKSGLYESCVVLCCAIGGIKQ